MENHSLARTVLPLAAALALAGPARAEFVAAPMELHYEVRAGTEGARVLKIHNKADVPLTVRMYVADSRFHRDGSEETLDPGTLARSCSNWVRLDENVLDLEPHEVRAVASRKATGEEPAALLVDVENVGNTILRCTGEFELRNDTGAVAETIPIGTTEIIVPALQRLEAAPGIIRLTGPGPDDLDAGAMNASEVTLTVWSNVAWRLAVRRARDETGPGASSPVLVRIEDGPYVELGFDWVPAASGPAGTEKLPVRLGLRVGLSWTGTAPGQHELRLEYRLSPGAG